MVRYSDRRFRSQNAGGKNTGVITDCARSLFDDILGPDCDSSGSRSTGSPRLATRSCTTVAKFTTRVLSGGKSLLTWGNILTAFCVFYDHTTVKYTSRERRLAR